MITKKKDYNNVPVKYCSKCVSLKVGGMGDIEYCMTCGNTEISKSHISEWDKQYNNLYGKSFIETNK